MKYFFFGSFFRATLFILVISAFPAISIVFFTGLERSVDALWQAQTHALNAVHAVARIQTALTAGAYTLLSTLGKMDFVRAPDSDLTEFLDRLNNSHPALTDIFLVGDNGYVIASKSGITDFMRVLDRGYFSRAMEKNDFVAGDVTYSRIAKAPIFHFGYRIEQINGAPLTLVTGTQLSYYRLLLRTLSLPDGASIYLTDMQGRVVVSRPDDEPYGTIPGNVENALRERSEAEGVFLLKKPPEHLLVAYQRIPLTLGSGEHYMQVVFTMPESLVLADQQETQTWYICVLGVALFGIGLLSLVFVTGILLPPIKGMLLAAKAYAEGNFNVRLPVGGAVREFNDLANSMNAMAEAIEKREEELNRARDAANTASKNKGEFLANMSHEIRTPMNAIIGMAYLALKSDLTTRQRGYVTKIHEAASELLRVINDILELAKLDAGKLGMASITFAPRDIFAESQRHFSTAAKVKGITLHFSIAPNVPRNLMGDPMRFGQILGYLLDNAIRYTEVGSIAITCELEESTGTQAGICASVQDTGSGMDTPQVTALRRLFASEATPMEDTPPSQSSGLGLLLAHKLIRAMDGYLLVDSVLGKGTTFSAHLRFGICSSGRFSGTGRLSSLRALAVDDEPVSLAIIKELLESFGMQVVTEESPEQGLALLQRADKTEHPFDLVILDWRMPMLDGVEVTRRIKSDANLLHPPVVIMLSAYSWWGIAPQAEAAGVDSFLHKPINASVLFDTIMNLLDSPDARNGSAGELANESGNGHCYGLEGLPVLVVEDNIVNQQIAQEILALMGLRVTLAENGQKAFECLDAVTDQPPFAMVLMDLQMPVMDGYEATRRIRQISAPWAVNLPIIAMTAHSRASEEAACRAAGMNDYVGKPVDRSELCITMRRWLPPTPVEEVEEQMAIDEFRRMAQSNTPETEQFFSKIDEMLSRHLHEGRMQELRQLLQNGKNKEAALFLERFLMITRG